MHRTGLFDSAAHRPWMEWRTRAGGRVGASGLDRAANRIPGVEMPAARRHARTQRCTNYARTCRGGEEGEGGGGAGVRPAAGPLGSAWLGFGQSAVHVVLCGP